MSWIPAAHRSSPNDSSFHGSDGGSQSGQGRKEQYKVYVQNIPMEMEKESVDEFFSKCGQVVYSKLLEPKGGRNTVAGFISFSTEEAVEEAIQKLSGCSLGDGPPLRVMKPKASSNTSSGDNYNNRQSNDRNNRFGGGGSGGQQFGKSYHNSPSFNREKSPFSSCNDSNSNPGFHGSPGFHGNQSDSQKSFKSMLGRGETRNWSDSPRPGQSSTYPPLAPLRKDGPSQPVQNGYQEQNQTQGYQGGQLNQGYHHQPPVTQYQDQQTTQGYQGHSPSQAYQQPPSPSYQEQAPNQGYQQPGYQEPPQNQGYQQPGYQEPPQNQGYQQPGYQEQQQPSQGYQYNVPGQQGYQEPKSSQEQPPNQYGAPGQQGYQEPKSTQQQPPSQTYQQPPQSGYYEQPVENSYQYNAGYNEQAPQQNFQEQPPQQNYYDQPQQSYPQTTQQSYEHQAQQSYPEQTSQQTLQEQSYYEQPQQRYQEQNYPTQTSQPSYNQQQTQPSYQEQPHTDSYSSHEPNQVEAPANTSQSRSWADSFSSEMQNGSASFQEQSSWQPKSYDDKPSGGRDRVCHNCKEPGHFSRECPNPRQQGDKTCHKCGETGHFARECPNNTGSSCHKCGEVGHFARECPNKSGPGDAQLCHRCGESGHFARDCSQSPNRAGPTCHRCGKVGHISKDCSESSFKEGGGGGGCHRCGEMGHFARECPNMIADPARPAPVTYIPEELPNDIEELFHDAPHSGINFDKYDNIPVKVSGVNEPPPINSFEAANFGSQCRANIRRAGFVKPTPVQKYTFPIVLSGRDLMACAQTGSGKTVAFLLPTLTNIINRGLPSASRSPLVLCLVPTRELAVQIYKEAIKFSDGTPVKVSVVYGGVSVAYQAQQLEQGCHFLAATPGRLLDFISRERIYLDSIQYLILDEADRMLDMGFEKDIRKIVEQSNMTDKMRRQTLMFSATFPDEIQRLAWDFLKTDFLFLAVGRVGGTNLDIQQTVMQVNGSDKRDRLFDILNASGRDRTLVFVELKRVADFLACLLSENNFPTTSISSDRNQSEREAALRDFRNGRAYVMVATSVAARGLDIPDVKHVVNYDLPQEIDEYVHRIGRTGRIGNQGKATSFFEQGRDEKLARSLVKVLSEAAQDVPAWLEKVAEDAVGSGYGPKGGRFSSRDQREGGARGRRNDYQTSPVSNFNAESIASSQFGSQVSSYNATSMMNQNTANMQNGPAPSSLPTQGTPSYNVGGGATGDSDDDWD